MKDRDKSQRALNPAFRAVMSGIFVLPFLSGVPDELGRCKDGWMISHLKGIYKLGVGSGNAQKIFLKFP
jgi:hypothetical protein